MDAIDLLRQEHRDIERVLVRMQQAIAEARAGGGMSAALFHRAAEFLKTQVEGKHHLKEHMLHRELRAHGLMVGKSLMRRLAEEHAIGREMSRELGELAEAVMADEPVGEALLASAEGYIRLHRAHSGVEEREFLPLAQRLLSTEAQDRLRSRFARVEASAGPLSDAADALEWAFGAATPGRSRGGEGRR
jgi:hemerythrin-like domain-containing protein